MAPTSNKQNRRRQHGSSKLVPANQQMTTVSSVDVESAKPTPAQSDRLYAVDSVEDVLPINKHRRIARSRSESSSSASSVSTGSYHHSPLQAEAQQSYPYNTRSGLNHSTTSLRSINTTHPGLPRSRSTAHLTTFAPPFYNRPPTPLLPSPSFTSLLRPSFSATPSRPTTPTDSEAEGFFPASTIAGSTTGTSEALLSTANAAQPVARASPKVPTYEYYGFVLYLTSSLFFLGHILWSFLPSPFLHQLGIYYYPDRWWSLAIPAWIVMAVGYIYVGLSAYNVEILTLPLGSLGAVVDEVGVVAVLDERGLLEEKHRRKGGKEVDDGRAWEWRDVWNESTDAVLDVPIGGVCEILYADEDDEA